MLTSAITTENVVELTKRLVKVPSVTGAEAALCDVLAQEISDVGFKPEIHQFAPGRPNVYGHRPSSSGPTPQLLLVGHVDTVNVRGWEGAWTDDPRADPFSATVVDGALWGRGVADQKGGIAAILVALRALDQAGILPHVGIDLAFVGDEESGEPSTGRSEGIKAYAASVRSGDLACPDFAVYTEPTAHDIYTSQVGFVIGVISVQGEGSYFSRPWLGRDAIRGAHTLLTALYEYESRVWSRARHPGVGRPSFVVTGITGGESVSVPATCELSFIRTLLPGERLDEVRVDLEELLARAAIERGVHAEISYMASRDHPIGGEPNEVDPDLPAVKHLQTCARRFSAKADLTGAPYWSELSILSQLGVPGVYFGPGDIAVCHTPSEHVPLSDLVAAGRALAAFIATCSAHQITARAPDPRSAST
jgi:acetylornithine deacetylase/succinyl-diaminopimelate desuccinylase-like protein